MELLSRQPINLCMTQEKDQGIVRIWSHATSADIHLTGTSKANKVYVVSVFSLQLITSMFRRGGRV